MTAPMPAAAPGSTMAWLPPRPNGALRRAGATALAAVLAQAAAGAASVAAAPAGDARPSCLVELAASYERPFGPWAPWNVPVIGLPTHLDSQRYVEQLWRHASERPGNINLTFEEYTYPVYEGRMAEGWYPVETEQPSNLDGAEIPWHPGWLPASGSDGQVIILDPESGREWDLWRVRFDGSTVRASNGRLVPGSYWTREVGHPASRGAGIPYLAMLVRPAEIARNLIPHALSMAIRGIHESQFVPPATNSDGSVAEWAVAEGIPEGTRFALDVTDAEIKAWAASLPISAEGRQSARVIARALRDYGWFITDNGGSAHLQFEDRLTAGPAWATLGLDVTVAGDKQYPRDLLDGLLREERIYAVVPSDRYPAELRASPEQAAPSAAPGAADQGLAPLAGAPCG
jgi:hypothetical protein